MDAEGNIVEGAWTAGDVAAVPDLSGGGVGGFCVPNAQHAVRQAKLLAKNITGVLRGEQPADYVHKNLGAVAGLGLYNGVFQSGRSRSRASSRGSRTVVTTGSRCPRGSASGA